MTDTRDMRDPEALGGEILSRLKHYRAQGAGISARGAANYMEQHLVPDYHDSLSPLERYGRPQDLPEAYTHMEADGLTPKRVLD